MPLQDGNAGRRPGLLPLPQPTLSLEITTSEQAPIRAPGQRADRTGRWHLLQGDAQPRVPEPDGGIMSPTGEQTAIGRKGQTYGSLGLPTRPEERSTRDFPQLDAAIMAPSGEQAFVRAEGEGKRILGMGLPGQVQPLAYPVPHPYFPRPADGRPVLGRAGGRAADAPGSAANSPSPEPERGYAHEAAAAAPAGAPHLPWRSACRSHTPASPIAR